MHCRLLKFRMSLTLRCVIPTNMCFGGSSVSCNAEQASKTSNIEVSVCHAGAHAKRCSCARSSNGTLCSTTSFLCGLEHGCAELWVL